MTTESNLASRNRSEQGASLIYVVDDEPMVLELTSIILEPCGYRVEKFRLPESALQAFENAKPQPTLLITDYAMQPMNGLELAAACRQIRPDQKILLVSGTVGSDIIINAPVKPDCFLAKPYQAKQLIDTVAALMAA